MRRLINNRFMSLILTLIMVMGLFTGLKGTVSANPASGFCVEMLSLNLGVDTSELNLTWYGDTSDGSVSKVQFGPADTFPAGSQLVTGTAEDVSFGDGQEPNGYVSHKATLTGLTPNTEFSYSVSNDGVTYSCVYTYQTPAADAFTFAVVGDPQLTTGNQDFTSGYFSSDGTTKQGWQETVDAIAAKDVNFIAFVGDQVDTTTNGKEEEYENFLAPLQSIAFSPAVGNHDRHYLFSYHYNLPNEMSFEPIVDGTNRNNQQMGEAEAAGNYWYTYNNALFVVLNDSAYPDSKEAAAPYIERFDATLKAATEANPNYTWLFVQHHKSTESIADHVADRDIQYYVEAGFETLMDKYEVDFVLAGHDHVYARSYPMNAGVPDKTGMVSEVTNTVISGGGGAVSGTDLEGTVYFTTTTGSGLKYYELFNNAGNLYVKDNAFYPYLVNDLFGSLAYMEGNLPLSTAKYLQNKTPGYLYVRVEENTVSFELYDVDGYAATPYDTYTVTKTVTSDLAPYISGYSDGTFKPDNEITRAEAAQMLYNLENGEIITSLIAPMSAATFTDVDAGEWYYEAVMHLAETGVISGYPDGSFGPDQVISRAEFTTMIVKRMGLVVGGASGFPDVPENHWAAGFIAAAKSASLISGYPNGNFGPEDSATRAEAVTILNKMMGRSTEETLLGGLTMPFNDVPTTHWAYYQIMAAAVEHSV